MIPVHFPKADSALSAQPPHSAFRPPAATKLDKLDSETSKPTTCERSWWCDGPLNDPSLETHF